MQNTNSKIKFRRRILPYRAHSTLLVYTQELDHPSVSGRLNGIKGPEEVAVCDRNAVYNR